MKFKSIIGIVILLTVMTLVIAPLQSNDDATIKLNKKIKNLIQSYEMGKPQISSFQCDTNNCRGRLYLRKLNLTTDQEDYLLLANIKIPRRYCSNYNEDIILDCLTYSNYTKLQMISLRNNEIESKLKQFYNNTINNKLKIQGINPGEITLTEE